MEPNNFEKDFREKLNERKIEPSNKAWDRLDAMLSVAEEKKPKKSKKWLYIAASVIGFLSVSTIYFNRFETVEINKDVPIVLEEKKEKDTLDKRGVNKDDMINLNSYTPKKIMRDYSIVADIESKKTPSKHLENSEKISNKNNLKGDSVIAKSSENKNYQLATKNKYISAEELLAEVSGSKFEPKETLETIEKKRKAVSVNPNDLLLNAETELNQSYRESALDKFNKNLKAVKSAIANRNYEE
ncbi:hypothetical protein [Flavobacterium branchiicola]|uniref:Anti-sigma factor n=1 Tax=Flavobacterium branchiicola TaxID=1114875 RepID=A0ABV9P8F1_9FLAO|nr:hypothetical protein [Flavobacterium branchiicola]MBS7252528.1 hypothetical protein [Flavobacterium branchiicola]